MVSPKNREIQILWNLNLVTLETRRETTYKNRGKRKRERERERERERKKEERERERERTSMPERPRIRRAF
jgi:hypothetical protein